jgi:hypothetical protein
MLQLLNQHQQELDRLHGDPFNAWTVETVTVSTTLTNENTVLVDTTGGNIVITLPAASDNENKVYNVKRITGGGNSLTITPDGVDTIDGAANKTISSQWGVYTIVSDGTGWFII